MMNRHVVGVLMLSGLLSCGAGSAQLSAKSRYDFVVPKDAQALVKERVGPSDQILFTVQRRYPVFAFSDETIDRLVKEGWKKCTSTSDDWSSFVDMASGSALRVHQKVLHLRKADRLLVLIGRYTSPTSNDSGRSPQVPPSSDQQTANVIGVTGSSAELDEALKMFSARC